VRASLNISKVSAKNVFAQKAWAWLASISGRVWKEQPKNLKLLSFSSSDNPNVWKSV